MTVAQLKLPPPTRHQSRQELQGGGSQGSIWWSGVCAAAVCLQYTVSLSGIDPCLVSSVNSNTISECLDVIYVCPLSYEHVLNVLSGHISAPAMSPVWQLSESYLIVIYRQKRTSFWTWSVSSVMCSETSFRKAASTSKVHAPIRGIPSTSYFLIR